MTPKTARAIKKYGRHICEAAYGLHTSEGWGASSVAIELGLKTNQADAAINAGRELANPAIKAVVIWTDYTNDEKGETKVFGPFNSGDEATAFGFRRLRGEEWFWEEMRPID